MSGFKWLHTPNRFRFLPVLQVVSETHLKEESLSLFHFYKDKTDFPSHPLQIRGTRAHFTAGNIKSIFIFFTIHTVISRVNWLLQQQHSKETATKDAKNCTKDFLVLQTVPTVQMSQVKQLGKNHYTVTSKLFSEQPWRW